MICLVMFPLPHSRRPHWSTASVRCPLLKEAGATHRRPPRARTCQFHVHVCKCSMPQHVVKVSCAPPLEFILSVSFFSDNNSFWPVNKFRKANRKCRNPMSVLQPSCFVSKCVDFKRKLTPIPCFCYRSCKLSVKGATVESWRMFWVFNRQVEMPVACAAEMICPFRPPLAC